LRLNDFKAAYDIVHAVVRLGFEMRRGIKESMQLKRRNRELTPRDESYLLSRTDKISRELGDIHEKYREIKEKWVASYATQIEHIIKENEGSAPDILVTKLGEAAFPSEIIYILRTTDPRFHSEEEEKPHFWEFWK
jgi:predicted nuclease with TOPRIM domain